QMNYIYSLDGTTERKLRVKSQVLDMTYDRLHGAVGLESQIKKLANQACQAVSDGYSILILSDRNADVNRPPIPGLLALRAVVNKLNESGLRLDASIVVDSGEIKNTH